MRTIRFIYHRQNEQKKIGNKTRNDTSETASRENVSDHDLSGTIILHLVEDMFHIPFLKVFMERVVATKIS